MSKKVFNGKTRRSIKRIIQKNEVHLVTIEFVDPIPNICYKKCNHSPLKDPGMTIELSLWNQNGKDLKLPGQ